VAHTSRMGWLALNTNADSLGTGSSSTCKHNVRSEPPFSEATDLAAEPGLS
jgi:hypothetical protein